MRIEVGTPCEGLNENNTPWAGLVVAVVKTYRHGVVAIVETTDEVQPWRVVPIDNFQMTNAASPEKQ